MKSSVKNTVLAAVLIGVSGGLVAADPIPAGPRLSDRIAPKLPAGGLVSLKPDLTVTGAGPDGEFCLDGCEAYVRDIGYQHNHCGWNMWVKNQGNARSAATHVELSLYAPRRTSPIATTVPLPALDPGESKFIRIPSPNAGGRNVGYYDVNRGITIKVDPNNTVNESNEGNNTLNIRP